MGDQVPIVVRTAGSDSSDMVSGLESRANDDVIRPIGTQVPLLISAPPSSIPQS